MAISLSTEAGLAGSYPAVRFNQRERAILSSVKTYVDAQVAASDDLVEDLTPQLGGNLDVNGKSIVSVSDGDIAITPNGTGDVIVDGLKHPQADGNASEVMVTDGAAQLSFSKVSVGADDGLTVDDDANVAGLSSAITLVNSVKSTINTHYADATEHTSGQQTAIAGADATDLASILSLTGEMLTSYAAHDDDAILAAAWAYHVAQGTERALVSAVTPTTLAEAITRLNDLKAKLNLHMADGTAHADGDTPSVATADAAMGAAVNVPVSGAVSGDLVVWGILNGGSGSVTGVSAVADTDQVLFTFSADPQADTIISYLVIRI